MAKGPYLIPRIENILRDIYLANRQIKPKEARESLLEAMKREELDQTFGSNFPSISTVSKELKGLRDKDAARSPESKGLDAPWNVVAMAKYDIPPEVLPIILKLWSQIMEKAPELATEVLTIRIARWIGRLYYVFKEQMPLFLKGIPEDKRAKADNWLIFLLLYAGLYAHHEKVIELVGYPSTYEDASALWWRDAELAGNEELADKLREGLGDFPDFHLLRKVDKRLWPITTLMGKSQGKRPRHGVKLPKDKEEAKDESSSVLQSVDRRPRKGRNKPGKPTRGVFKKGKRARLSG